MDRPRSHNFRPTPSPGERCRQNLQSSFVALTKSLTLASGPPAASLSTTVGNVKFHHLKPVIGLPEIGSLPFAVNGEM